MQENQNDSELALVVTGTRRDGRRRYDPRSKRRLAEACLQPGVSLAGMALRHGVNANLLRKWVVNYQRESTSAAPQAGTGGPADRFVPVVMAGGADAQMDKSLRAPLRPVVAASASAQAAPSRLRAQLPNGVTLEFECAGPDAALVSTVIETLGRCDVSPRR
jgi:transposase